MKKFQCRLLIVFSLLFPIFFGVSYLFVWNQLNNPITLSGDIVLDFQGRYLFSIEKGSNLKLVNNQLSNQQIINYPLLVTGWARLVKKDQVQAGDYWISSVDTPNTLINKFFQGDVAQHSITFLEGWSFKQWISQLAEIPQFAFVKNMYQLELFSKIGADIDHPEGWFFPDTYYYSKNDNVFSILKQAHSRMQAELELAWQSKASDLPYKTPYEALIMASIIEKETGQADERADIAGVFVRRLQQGMRLQTDPTVIYGMGDSYEGNIRRSDLRNFTPYNTYRIDGLPPTPIAMPGLASIEAALHPESGSSLYFVARGDGSHHFSDTISQHIEAVRKFQIEQRVKDYQSAPKKP
ncbi:MAG: endolytic transglycosylase MltG [Porticoccaceae bacterium]|nr:endolytic transglycosylase MltG [Porticoccaceae bacterium]